MAGVYAADGSMNVTVVTGATITGLYAPNGSINVVESTGSNYLGLHHPCGAWWVTLVSSGQVSRMAPNGSLNVDTSPYNTNATRVTVVGGSFGGGGGGSPIGLLLALTH